MSTRMRSSRRAPVVLLVLFAVLFSLAPALATPASAGTGDDIGQNGGRAPNSIPDGGRIWYKCVNGEGVHMNGNTASFVRYRYPWVGCRWNGRGWEQNWDVLTHGYDRLCHVGFEVYRFYSLGGSYNNPAEPHAWTRSTISYPEWCQPQPVSLFYPNPEDSGAPHVATPWVAQRGMNIQKDSYLQPWTRTSRGTAGTNALVSASRNKCDNLMVGMPGRPADPMPQFLRNAAGQKGAKYDTAAGAQLRKDLLATYNQWKATSGWQAALTIINAANTSPLNSNGNGDDIRYGDGKNCSSDMDFATLDAPGSPHMFYGTCYVPIMSRATEFYNRRTGEQLLGYYTPAAGRGGLRYSQEYASNRGPTVGSWRDKMYAIIANSSGPGPSYTGARNNQNTGAITDRRKAAQQVRDTARCVRGVASSFTSSGAEAKPIPAAEVRLTLTLPDVFQTGWGMAAGANTVSVSTAPGLMCDNPATKTAALVSCDSLAGASQKKAPKLASLHFGATMKGTNGYVGPMCPSSDAGCDFKVENYPSLLTSVSPGPPLPVSLWGSQKYVDQPVTFTNPMFYSPVQRDATPTNGKGDAEQVEVRLDGGHPKAGALPTASYFEPLVGKTVYTHRYSVPTNGEPQSRTNTYTIDILEHTLKNVPVSVYHNGKEVARFENGELVKGSSSWLRDAIGASGMTN